MKLMGLEDYWKKCLLVLLHDDDHSLVGVHKLVLNDGYGASREYVQMIGSGVYDLMDYPLKSWLLQEYVTQLEDIDRIYLQDIEDKWTFPERLCNYFPFDRELDEEGFVDNVNQLDVICRKLILNKNSNNAIAVLYIPHIDSEEEDIPNLQYVQFIIKDNNLYMIVMFSEHDFYNDFIKDMLFLKYLGLTVCDCLEDYYPEISLYMIDYSCGKIYINNEDLENIKGSLDLNE